MPVRTFGTFMTKYLVLSNTVKQFQGRVVGQTSKAEQIDDLCSKNFLPRGMLLSGKSLDTFSLVPPSLCCQCRHYSIKRKDYEFPELKPEDLEESFVRGGGPGGQAVNKTANCVVLKHKPSGIVVKCQETRSLDDNRKKARLKLKERLDLHLHGDQSYLSQCKAEASDAKKAMKSRAKKRLALKIAFKEEKKLE